MATDWTAKGRTPKVCPRCKEKSMWGAPRGGDFRYNKKNNETERAFNCTRCGLKEYRKNWGTY